MLRLVIPALCILAVVVVSTEVAATTKVSGKIQDESGQPQQGVVVRLEPAAPGPPALQTKTKKKGQYYFGMVRRGEYRLALELTGMRVADVDLRVKDAEGRTVVEFAGAVAPGSQLPTIEVGDNDTVTYNLTLAQGKKGAEGEFGTGLALLGTGEIVDLIQKGNTAKAQEEISRGLDVTPDDAKLHYLRAFLQMQEKQLDEGLASIDRALTLDSSFPGAHSLKGNILQERGETEAAVAEFRAEIDVTTDPQLRRDAYVRIAMICKKQEQTDCWIEALQEIIELDPEDSTAYAQLMDAYGKSGRYDELNALLETAPEELRQDPTIYFNMGATHWNEGHVDAAIAAFSKAAELDPTMADAYHMLGYCKVGQGDYDGAIADLERYLELAPEAADAGETRVLIDGLQAKRKQGD